MDLEPLGDIGVYRAVLTALGGHEKTAFLLQVEAVLAHDTLHFLRVYYHAAVPQFGDDTTISIVAADFLWSR